MKKLDATFFLKSIGLIEIITHPEILRITIVNTFICGIILWIVLGAWLATNNEIVKSALDDMVNYTFNVFLFSIMFIGAFSCVINLYTLLFTASISSSLYTNGIISCLVFAGTTTLHLMIYNDTNID
jgi:hypothetical protein